jgi:hypothetical protein
MKHIFRLILVIALFLPVLPLSAQQDTSCKGGIPPRLEVNRHGVVITSAALPVYRQPDPSSEVATELAPGEIFQILEAPQCAGGINWWVIDTISAGSVWLPESRDGAYTVEPFQFTPPPPVAMGVPMTDPVITSPVVPVRQVTPLGSPFMLASPYIDWDWAAYIEGEYMQAPDPTALDLPDSYNGDLPVPPVNLDTVRFVQDAGLNPTQLALLAQNGFVVVPGGGPQFDEIYQDYAGAWPHTEGKGDFITTDALLHALFVTYQNALMYLELDTFYRLAANFVEAGYSAAEAQWQQAAGTALEGPAFNAAVYYAVTLSLLADGEEFYVDPFSMQSLFELGEATPRQILATVDPAILTAAQPIIAMIRQAEGVAVVPIFEELEEDFSQYKVRGYYAGNPLLESYFRAMMWMGRITFKAKNEGDTLAALLVLRALQQDPAAYADWQYVADTLAFLVGPVDDLGPPEYAPLAEQVFGTGLPLEALSNPAMLDAFLEGVRALPGPRINSIPLPVGITAEAVDEFTRGFRLFGQRFTLDGYIMQQLIYPEVGTAAESRALPLGLDIAAVVGSDTAFALADDAGATSFANYTEHVDALRQEVNDLDASNWLENLYGGWLWALQPLLVRDQALVPPMMQTDAWRRKDINTMLGSWTELKHATLLYSEQPMGGLGGGGMMPPVTSTSTVEPNPLVFARIAIVAGTLDQGLQSREMVTCCGRSWAISSSLKMLSILSARLAELARLELAGEPIPYDELYFLQENFGHTLWFIRYGIEQWVPDPPEDVVLVADVASNASAGLVLEEGIGDIDLIYVVTNSPHGLQLTRGAVYTQYEFTQPINNRLTDDEWRVMLASEQAPPRHDWTALYFSE